MTVHSTRLGAGSALGTGPTTLYTVPSNKRTILKSLMVRNTSSSANGGYLEVAFSGGPTIAWWVSVAADGSAGGSVQVDLWLVLNVGDVVKWASHAAGADVVISGAELSLT